MTPLQACIVSLLTLVIVVGILGNILIIIIYARKTNRSSANIFIIALAVTDLFVCLVLPTIIYDVLNAVNGNKYVCLIKHYTSAFGVHLAFVLCGLIALDRFWAVSRPHRRLLNVGNSKIIVCLSLVASGILTIPQFIIVDMLKVQLPNYSFYICNVEPSGVFQKTINLFKYFTILSICFMVCGLYFKLYRIIKSRAKVGGLVTRPNLRHVDSDITTGETHANSISKNVIINSDFGKSSGEGSGHSADVGNSRNEGNSVQHGPPLPKRRSHIDAVLRNRTTRMLIVVTSVMCISWIPPAVIGIVTTFIWENPQQRLLLMGDREKWTTVLFQMFFSINHASNAIIYGAINKNFRQDTLALFRKLGIYFRLKCRSCGRVG